MWTKAATSSLSQACRLEDSLEPIWIYGLRTNIRQAKHFSGLTGKPVRRSTFSGTCHSKDFTWYKYKVLITKLSLWPDLFMLSWNRQLINLHAITNTYDWAALAFQKKFKLSCLRLANRRKSHKQAIAASFFFAFFNNANLPHSSSELKYKFLVSSGSISSLQQ